MATPEEERQRAEHEAAHFVVARALGYKPEASLSPTDANGNAGVCKWKTTGKTTPKEIVAVSLAPFVLSFLYHEDGDPDSSLCDFGMAGQVLQDFPQDERSKIIRESLERAALILKNRKLEVERITDELLKTQAVMA